MRRRALWGWAVAVLALHALVLLNLPRRATPLVAPAMAQVFTTRSVPAPLPQPVSAPERAPALPAAMAAPPPQARKTPPRPAPRRPAPVESVAAVAAAALPDSVPAAPGVDMETHSGNGAAVQALSADGAGPAVLSSLPSPLSAPTEPVAALVASAGTSAGAPAAPATPDTVPAAAPPPEEPVRPAAADPAAVGALAIFAPGSEQPLPGPAPAVQLPPPQRLAFDVTGQASKFQYSARAKLVWQHDGQHYQARQEVGILLLGARTQTSAGTLGPAGLQPQRFGDRSRSEKAAHFDYAQHRVTFSTNAPDAPLAAGTQDRLSVFVQLGALLAAAPERYPPGTRIRLDTAGTKGVDAWTFTVEGEETLELPAGSLRTLRLQRLPRPDHDFDQKAQLWLAPTLGYLPARIRLTQANGDFADLRLTNHGAP